LINLTNNNPASNAMSAPKKKGALGPNPFHVPDFFPVVLFARSKLFGVYLFEPHIPAGKALRLMHTEHRAALRTNPFLVFVFHKIPYANFPYTG
jgi:hypothetical protein